MSIWVWLWVAAALSVVLVDIVWMLVALRQHRRQQQPTEAVVAIGINRWPADYCECSQGGAQPATVLSFTELRELCLEAGPVIQSCPDPKFTSEGGLILTDWPTPSKPDEDSPLSEQDG